MYVIKADYSASGTWENLYYQGDPDYAAWDIECSLQMGDSGSVSLTVPLSHPEIARITTRKTLLDFQVDGTSLGVFEVREITHDIMGNAEVYAVGELAWLFDSVQPQAEYHDQTVRGFLQTLLAVHNTQCPEHQFVIGVVDVTDSNDSLYRYTNREQTLDCIRDKLVDRLGGNLRARRSGGTRYLDYVTDQTYGNESEQTIRFGENILDYSDNFTVDDICSEVIPLGARLENDKGDNSNIGNLEKRLTIESVNDGSDYISDQSLVARFGHIRTTCTWDDVTVPANLLAKAKSWLSSEQFEKMHISVQAVDLSLSDKQFGALRMGDRAYVICDHMSLKRSYVIRARTYHPDEPDRDTIELGDTEKASTSFVASQVQAQQAAETETRQQYERGTASLVEAVQNVTAMMTGNRGGYKITEYDDEGRWLADYILDSMDKDTAQVVKKVTVDGTAYSTTGVDGPYETAIMANGLILGKYIQAHSVTAEQISQDYTSQWENADEQTLVTARSEFKAADAEIAARVSQTETNLDGVRTDLAAEVKIRADQISQTVKRGQINSTIKQTAETIYIQSNKFGWESSYSSLTTDGKLTAKNAALTNCDVSGKITAGSGKIGGFTITSKSLYNGRSSLNDGTKQGVYLGTDGISVYDGVSVYGRKTFTVTLGATGVQIGIARINFIDMDNNLLRVGNGGIYTNNHQAIKDQTVYIPTNTSGSYIQAHLRNGLLCYS